MSVKVLVTVAKTLRRSPRVLAVHSCDSAEPIALGCGTLVLNALQELMAVTDRAWPRFLDFHLAGLRAAARPSSASSLRRLA